jgi:hypothetical protein
MGGSLSVEARGCKTASAQYCRAGIHMGPVNFVPKLHIKASVPSTTTTRDAHHRQFRYDNNPKNTHEKSKRKSEQVLVQW